MRVLFIFIDGVGLDNENQIFPGKYRSLKKIIDRSSAIDACLSVPGLPQSGTGQTSIFCGVNAQKKIGRHQYAFPDEKLKNIIKEENLFSHVRKIGKKVCFANAYTGKYLESETRRRSVTTWMTFFSGTEFLTENELNSGNAVYHDITNRSYGGSISVDIIEPEQAARNLLNISLRNDLTLFEYFLTDRIGHGRIEDNGYLDELDRFLGYIDSNLDENTALVITSDHGNIEIESGMHSRNPVPLYVKNYENTQNTENISHIKKLIIEILEI